MFEIMCNWALRIPGFSVGGCSCGICGCGCVCGSGDQASLSQSMQSTANVGDSFADLFTPKKE